MYGSMTACVYISMCASACVCVSVRIGLCVYFQEVESGMCIQIREMIHVLF